MNKKVPVASKICSRREDEKNYERHMKKLHEIRINNSRVIEMQYANDRVISTSSHLRRNNRKREIINELYYTEVERENRILLEKMSKIMRQQQQKLNPNTSMNTETSYIREPKSLNKIIRKRELVKITIENQELLKRIQEKAPTYNTNKWQQQFRQNEKYLQLISEFPIQRPPRATVNNNSFLEAYNKNDESFIRINEITRKMSSNGRKPEELANVNRSTGNSAGKSVDSRKQYPDFSSLDDKTRKKITLFKRGVRIGLGLYIVEISIDKRFFQITADDVENPDVKSIVLPIEEGRRLLSDNSNDYQKIVEKLYFIENSLRIKGLEAAMNPTTIHTVKTGDPLERVEEAESLEKESIMHKKDSPQTQTNSPQWQTPNSNSKMKSSEKKKPISKAEIKYESPVHEDIDPQDYGKKSGDIKVEDNKPIEEHNYDEDDEYQEDAQEYQDDAHDNQEYEYEDEENNS